VRQVTNVDTTLADLRGNLLKRGIEGESQQDESSQPWPPMRSLALA
jgi:hypothetical protein